LSEYISILGAGPAGLTAAINLGKAGYRVRVYERRRDVGMRFHNDTEGLESWNRTRDALDEFGAMSLDINFDYVPLSLLTGVAPDMKTYEIEAKKDVIYLLRRGPASGTLDHGLKEQALSAGVEIRFNQQINERDADIVATGPVSGKIAAIAKGITFSTSHPAMNLAMLDDNSSYKGYSYLLITEGYGTLCTVLFGRFNEVGREFELARSKISKIVGLDDIHDVKPAGGIGHFSNQCAFSKDGQSYIGETAGLQDLLWGFGMRTAVTSGYLAAKSIIEGKNYADLAEACFTGYLKNGIVNRYLYSMMGNRLYPYFLKVLASMNRPERLIQELYTYRFYKRCLYPLAIRSVGQHYPWLVK